MVKVLPVPVAMATNISRFCSAIALFDCRVRFDLVGTQAGVRCWEWPSSFLAIRGEVAAKQLFQRGWSVVASNAPRPVEGVANVVEPNQFAVRGIEERNVEGRRS